MWETLFTGIAVGGFTLAASVGAQVLANKAQVDRDERERRARFRVRSSWCSTG